MLYSLLLPIHVCMLVCRHRLTLLLDVATCDARLVGGVDHHRLPDDAAKTDAKATALNRQESELRPHHLRHTITSGIRMIV